MDTVGVSTIALSAHSFLLLIPFKLLNVNNFRFHPVNGGTTWDEPEQGA